MCHKKRGLVSGEELCEVEAFVELGELAEEGATTVDCEIVGGEEERRALLVGGEARSDEKGGPGGEGVGLESGSALFLVREVFGSLRA